MCLLCGEAGAPGLGALLPSVHCHELCIKFAAGLRNKTRTSLPKDVELVREVKRCRRLACVYCHRPGASVSCAGPACSRSYHLSCAAGRGGTNRHSDALSFCPAHVPFRPPRPSCPLCAAPVGQEVLRCPACSVHTDRSCLEDRLAGGLTSCPACEDPTAFSDTFRDVAVRAALATAASGPPSPTIAYLAKECGPGPALVTHKLSPMQQHLASQRGGRPRPGRAEEPVVRLSTVSPSVGAAPEARGSDSDVTMVSPSGWLSTPGTSTARRAPVVARGTKSLPSKIQAAKAPNRLISTFFKPIMRRSDASGSDVEVVNDTSSKNVIEKMAMAMSSSPVKAITSPKKVTSPFKTIRMCSTKIVRPVMKIEFTSDTGTEGPLSDIDDILTGSIPDLEAHPLANIVFHKSNPHLKEIMKSISDGDHDLKSGKGRARELESESEPEKKKKEPAVKKPRGEGTRNKTSKKGHDQRHSGSDTSGKSGSRKVQIRKLPLSSRQIYHGRSWVPMTTHGQGESEDECQCSWVMDYTGKKLEDIVDLNSAEKTMMNLWNKHVNKYQGRGTIHMEDVLTEFLTERSHTIIELNLYRNFVAHISGLQQANVISSETLFKSISTLQDVMKVLEQTSTVVGRGWLEQAERAREAECLEPAASPSRVVRSAGRPRPNSNLAGCVSPSHGRSPNRGTVASPSRPSSIGRGRRTSNMNKNVQKSLDLDHKFGPRDLFPQLASETTPGKRPWGGVLAAGRAHLSDSGGDTSASETGQEVASFLSGFSGCLSNTHTPPDGKEEPEMAIHVLTEEPDSELEGEAEPEESPEAEETPEVLAPPRRPSRSAAPVEMDFLGLQLEEYKKMVTVAREKDPGCTKVPVFYVSDDYIQFASEHLVENKPKEAPTVTALRNLFLKQKQQKASAKRKPSSSGTGTAAKKPRLDVTLPDLNQN